MASGKSEYWMSEDGLILIKGWARDGLTDEQIAHNMDIAYSTFRLWKDKYPAILAALKINKDIADYEVENALFQKALNGDTTAQIFWLKNRRPKNWRDRPTVDANAELIAKLDERLKIVSDTIKRETD